MSMNVRRPPSHVQAERLKGGGRLLSAFPTAGQQAIPMEKGSQTTCQKAPYIERQRAIRC